MCHFNLHFDHTMFCLRFYHWRCSRNSNFEKFIKLKPITKPCERSKNHGDCMVAPFHDVCVHISFTRFPQNYNWWKLPIGRNKCLSQNVVLKSSQMVPFLGNVSLGMFNLHDP
jgi:hypothetical protein